MWEIRLEENYVLHGRDRVGWALAACGSSYGALVERVRNRDDLESCKSGVLRSRRETECHNGG